MLESLRELDEQDNSTDLTEGLWFRKRKKIMIIDDDLDFRLSLSEILVDNGYSVTTAKDGEMALNHLIHDHDHPDLILVDVMMPIKGGLEFRREQNRIKEISDIPVIFVSGQGLVAGELCLQKPIVEDDIVSALKKFI